MKCPNLKALAPGCFALVVGGGSAYGAEENGNGFLDNVSGSLLFTTDYMFRSISNSNNRPAVQGDMNWSHDNGIYIGLWLSNTDFGGTGNSMELDPYIGIARDIGETNFSFDLGYWSYNYPGSKSNLDYAEIYLTPSYSKDKLSISPSFWYADNYFGEDFLDEVSAFAYEVTLGYDLPRNFSISGRIGEQTFEGRFDFLNFAYYDVGVTQTCGDFSFDLRWYDTDGVDSFFASPKLTDGRWVFGVTRNF
ncbi:TorF family putative porin [Microbulbifer taiwanensis]|uniref:TorF family putative porin n=1 Tax=Microbulbifer taiwanensis TaxID=986746 RepID=A0ABW1YIN4_9GAMM|nr:TorF family putative porin [Microbulbifer taiwanensis]